MNATAKEELTIIKIGDFDHNYMNEEGINEWFRYVGYFIRDGFAKIQRADGLQNYIDRQGNILSNEWFKLVGDFDEYGVALIQRGDGKWNFITKHGKLLSNEWFMWVDDFFEGFARVKRFDSSMNYINKDGKILSKEWFRYVYYFDEYDLAVVYRTNGEKCKIDKTGKIVSIIK